jgi:hypothetical protein
MCEGLGMFLLAVKLAVTPLMALAASLAARRWGDAIGGWLVGLPITSGPVAVFLAIEQGPAFAADAAAGSIAGVAAQAALGPRVSGVTASFPLIGASIAAFAFLAEGPAAGVAAMRGMAAALYVFAVFFLIAGAALERMPIAAAFALATAGALVTQGATLGFVRSRGQKGAAEAEAAASSPGPSAGRYSSSSEPSPQ